MSELRSTRRFVAVVPVWFVAAVLGLTVALFAVGGLGLWVAAGALAGLGATLACGWLGQLLFVSDLDAMAARKIASRSPRT